MKIKHEQPPNIAEIRAHLTPSLEATFCHGDTIYNPSARNLLPDIIHHEEVHSRQQAAFVSPDAWWLRYLIEPDFRLEQEIEAYGEQYAFASKHLEQLKGSGILKWALDSMATALSGAAYGNLISYGEAVSKIRNHAKTVVQ